MSIIKVLEDVRQSPLRNVGLYTHVEQRYLHLQRGILTFTFTGGEVLEEAIIGF